MVRLIGAVAMAVLMTAACGGDSDTAETAAPADAAQLPASPGVERSEPVAGAPVADLARGWNDAGFDLWRTQPPGENLVFSPMSIGHALLMARAAADEPTGAAIDAAFGLPTALGAHQAWNAIDHQLMDAATAEEELTITVADRIWPRLDVQPDQEWIDLLAAEHGVTVEPLDLQGDPEGSRQVINDWVGDRTGDLIPDLLPAGSIHSQTVLVLTDAVYFEAQWQKIFGKYGPVQGDFSRLDGTTVPVEYMQELELEDGRGVGGGWSAAEIPYVGGDLSMLVIVPDEGGFDDMRDQMDQALLDEIDAALTTGPYELLLPKWETNSQLDLLAWLEELGTAPGLYPAITPTAFLDAAVHGADIAVDEWGTVAAAATGLNFAESGPGEPELTIAADRPFLYLIRHRPSGTILFAGQVTDPTA